MKAERDEKNEWEEVGYGRERSAIYIYVSLRIRVNA